MRVLVFGASGATGRLIAARALERHFAVTAFVRRPEKLALSHPHLRVAQGDVADSAAVESAVADHDAVICALGVSRPLHPDPAVVSGVRHIVRAMESLGITRLVYLSFIGLPDSRAAAGPVIRYVARYPLRHEISDHEQKERIVRGSALQWTIVRPPTLTTGPHTGRYRAGETIATRSVLPRLSRADVADFMLSESHSPQFERTIVRVLP